MSARTRVLVVEDDSIARRLMLASLSRTRFHVRTAPDAVTALAEIAGHRPDIILVDIGMVGVSGLQLSRLLAEMHLAEDVPVVALSAFDLPEYRAAAVEAGLDGFIAKPIDTRTITDQVIAYVEQGTRGARRRPARPAPSWSQRWSQRRRGEHALFMQVTGTPGDFEPRVPPRRATVGWGT
jgi:DNA-binding response OmpR family regulator